MRDRLDVELAVGQRVAIGFASHHRVILRMGEVLELFPDNGEIVVRWEDNSKVSKPLLAYNSRILVLT
jgi:hypothetical protein